MPELTVGEKVKVRYQKDIDKYTLHVRVIEVCPPNEFAGVVEAVFLAGIGMVQPGSKIVEELEGQERTFNVADIF